MRAVRSAVRFIDYGNEGTAQMIVIGADTHKRNHVLAAVDDVAGGVRGAREIKADETGRMDAWFGRAAWMTSGCGQSRIVGTSRGALGPSPMLCLTRANLLA